MHAHVLKRRDKHPSAALDISPLNEIRCIHLDHGEPAASERCDFVNLPTAEEDEEVQ